MTINFAKEIEKSSFTNQLEINQNKPGLPQHPARILLLGPSGCGKSNLCLNFLLDSPSKLNYTKLYLFAKDLSEPSYEYLLGKLDAKEEKIRKYAEKHGVELPEDFSLYYAGSKLEDVPDVNSIDREQQNIVVFDDFATESEANQAIISEFFIRSRKQNCTCIYISQGYKVVPKIVRDQVGYTAIFKPSGGYEITSLARNYGTDLEPKEFRKLVNETTKKRGDYLWIDINEPEKSAKYRYNLSKKTKWS